MKKLFFMTILSLIWLSGKGQSGVSIPLHHSRPIPYFSPYNKNTQQSIEIGDDSSSEVVFIIHSTIPDWGTNTLYVRYKGKYVAKQDSLGNITIMDTMKTIKAFMDCERKSMTLQWDLQR